MTEVRDRLSERLTLDRVKLESRRAGPHLVWLLLAAAASLVALAMIFRQMAPHLVQSTNTVRLEVDSARAVKPGLNEIRMKGIPVGRITGLDAKDGRTVITAQIDKDYGEVYRDARAELRPNSALEDQFVDIVDRGHPAAGRVDEDHPLAASRTTVPVGVDEVLSTFDGDTRVHLRRLLAELGAGLDDRGGQLQQAFVAAVPLLDAAGRLTHQLAVRKERTQRLVRNASTLTAELGRRDVALRKLIGSGATTMAALRDRSGALDATLRELPPVLSAVTASFRATRGVLGDVDGAVTSLRPVADRLDGGLDAVRALSRDAAPAVDALQRPVRRLAPFADSLVPLSQNLATTIARLRPQVPTLNKVTKDLANCKKGVQGFFHWDASMTKYGDSRGQAPRGTLAAGIQTLGLASPWERAYGGCVEGAPIGGRPPAKQDER